jgi:hypothetical protein
MNVTLVSPDYFNLIRREMAELRSNYPGAFYPLFDIATKLT